MHGRPRLKPQDIDKLKEEAKRLKIIKFNESKSQLIEQRAQGNFELSTLDALSNMVTVSPDINTLWNYRKQIITRFIQQSIDQGDLPWASTKQVVDPNRDTFAFGLDATDLQLHKHDKIRQLLETEIKVTEKVLRERHVKSYCCWYHRKWAIKHLPQMWEQDLQLCALLLSQDERNFHCWNYRRYVLQLAKIPAKDELDYTLKKLEEKPSNYSAWHNRSYLLWENNKVEQKSIEDVLENEFEVVQPALYTDPEDQSAWIYHRWLLQTPHSQNVLEKELLVCKDLLEEVPNSRFVILNIVLNHLQNVKAMSNNDYNEVIGHLDNLQQIDRMHVNYYKDVKSDLIIQRELHQTNLSINHSGLTRIDAVNKYDSNLLQSVDFSHNEIRMIPTLKALPISTLNLSNNNIEFVEGIQHLGELKELDLSHNKIERLNSGPTPLSTSVQTLRLTGNPIVSTVPEEELRSQVSRLFPNATLSL